MAVGKNKRLSKGSKKGGKRKTVDPFIRKEWYNLRVPAVFDNRNIGKTCANKTVGNKLASTNLLNRCYEIFQGELANDKEAHTKYKFICEDVDLRNCKLMFYGMEKTRDKQMAAIKKWQTYIECEEKVTTTDGYTLRVFIVATTERNKDQQKKTTYAQSKRVADIKKIFRDQILSLSNCNIKDIIKKLLPDSIATDCKKLAQAVYPLENCMTKKVKVVKRPVQNKQRVDEAHEEVTTGSGGTKMTEVAPVDEV